jgi:hypothetical protein
MKVMQDWTFRDGERTVDYKAGDELHDFAVGAAKTAGVTEKDEANGDGAAKAGSTSNANAVKGK